MYRMCLPQGRKACKAFWSSWVEPNAERLTKLLQMQKTGQYTLIRLCKKLAQRMSKTHDSSFCGQVRPNPPTCLRTRYLVFTLFFMSSCLWIFLLCRPPPSFLCSCPSAFKVRCVHLDLDPRSLSPSFRLQNGCPRLPFHAGGCARYVSVYPRTRADPHVLGDGPGVL